MSRLTFQKDVEGRPSYASYLCDCGKSKVIYKANVNRGLSQSCGCLRNERLRAKVVTHGHASGGRPTREYNSYAAAKQRCLDPNSNRYYRYGARGIEFRFNSFQQFLDCVGPRPANTSIDRIDPNGHYECGNVRWADNATQRRNRAD